MFADFVKLGDMVHTNNMTMLVPHPTSCALPNTTFIDSNMAGGYFCPATLNGSQVYQYVQGENETFKQKFGPDEKSKEAQFCANIPGVGVSCSTYVPCGASFSTDDLVNMKGNSCGCIGFKYCVNGVGTNAVSS